MRVFRLSGRHTRFNTQPPEGGWGGNGSGNGQSGGFNTQPPEGGWGVSIVMPPPEAVSTHSRPKAAGIHRHQSDYRRHVSTHSRPKAAGCRNRRRKTLFRVSTHSRPKAAGGFAPATRARKASFNTQPPEGGWPPIPAVRKPP